MKNTIQKILKLFGYRLVNLNSLENRSKESLIYIVFNLFHEVKFYPKHILDIGANHGTWIREVLKYYPSANYTLVEPQEWLKDTFSDLLKSGAATFDWTVS